MRFVEFLQRVDEIQLGGYWINATGDAISVRGDSHIAVAKDSGFESIDEAEEAGWIRIISNEWMYGEFSASFTKPTKKAMRGLFELIKESPEYQYYIIGEFPGEAPIIREKRKALQHVGKLLHMTEAKKLDEERAYEYGAWIDSRFNKVYKTDFEGHGDFILDNHDLFGIPWETFSEGMPPDNELYNMAFNNGWIRVIFPSEDTPTLYVEGRKQDVKKAWPNIRPYTKMRLGKVIVDLLPKGGGIFHLPEERGKMIRFFTGTITEAVMRVPISKEKDVRVFVNPSVDQLKSLVKRTEFMRGLLADDIYWWDAGVAVHETVAKALGVKDYLDRRLEVGEEPESGLEGFKVERPLLVTTSFGLPGQITHSQIRRLLASDDIVFPVSGHGNLTYDEYAEVAFR